MHLYQPSRPPMAICLILMLLSLLLLACGGQAVNDQPDGVVAPTAPPFSGGGGGGDTVPSPTSAAVAVADNPLPTAPPADTAPDLLPATWTPVPTATTSPIPVPATPVLPTAPAPVNASMGSEVPGVGADVIVDEIRWRVSGAQSLGQTLVGDAAWVETLRTEGQFVSISFEVENQDNDPRTFWDPRLMDSLGRSYDVVPNRWAYLGDNEDCILEQLNPSVPQSCTLVYELPSDAAGVYLIATPLDWFDPQTRAIDVGLP